MSNLIRKENIKKLISNDSLSILDLEECKIFNSHLCSKYPMVGYAQDRVDWDNIENYFRINCFHVSDEEIGVFFKNTNLSKYEYIAIVDSTYEPGIVGKFSTVCKNIDVISGCCMWVMYFVGASKDKYGIYRLHPEDFVELWGMNLEMTAPR